MLRWDHRGVSPSFAIPQEPLTVADFDVLDAQPHAFHRAGGRSRIWSSSLGGPSAVVGLVAGELAVMGASRRQKLLFCLRCCETIGRH